MGRIAENQREKFWAGFDRTFQKLGFDPDFEGTIRNTKTIYDPGQNVDILLEYLLQKKDVNWLEIPGGENCSSLIASAFNNGLIAIGWHSMTLFAGFPNVYETADVAPGHFGMASNDFRVVKVGEPIRAGCVKISMSWDDPQRNAEQLLKALIVAAIGAMGITNWLSAYAFLKSLYERIPDLFDDAEKIVQRDHFRMSDPWWHTKHAEAIWRIKGDKAKIIGQELFMKEYAQPIDSLYAQMAGDKPSAIVLEPIFLYG